MNTFTMCNRINKRTDAPLLDVVEAPAEEVESLRRQVLGGSECGDLAHCPGRKPPNHERFLLDYAVLDCPGKAAPHPKDKGFGTASRPTSPIDFVKLRMSCPNLAQAGQSPICGPRPPCDPHYRVPRQQRSISVCARSQRMRFVLFHQSGQCLPQLSSAARETRHDRANRRTGHLRNLTVRKTFDLSQHQDLAKDWRQLVKRRAHKVAVDLAKQLRLGRRFVGGNLNFRWSFTCLAGKCFINGYDVS
jgi:hypothetical protein